MSERQTLSRKLNREFSPLRHGEKDDAEIKIQFFNPFCPENFGFLRASAVKKSLE
jgi:hypothetical protein